MVFKNILLLLIPIVIPSDLKSKILPLPEKSAVLNHSDIENLFLNDNQLFNNLLDISSYYPDHITTLIGIY